MIMPSQTTLIPVAEHLSLHTHISTTEKPNERPALLLLHFWGGSYQTYNSVIDRLQDDFNLIAPSLRGWGDSSRPGDDDAYTTRDYADDIVHLINSLHSSQPGFFTNGLVVIGHSMGGKIAQLLLASGDVPQDLIRVLVLLAPAPVRSFRLPEDMRKQQIHAYGSEPSASFVIENVLLGKPSNITAALRSEMASTACSGSLGARMAWPEYGMSEEYEDFVLAAIHGRKERQALRMLVLVGELDRVETPENVRKNVAEPMMHVGVDVSIEVLEGVGHLLPVEAPDAVAEAIRKMS
ncbi:Soluble epoxide hydrolase [Pseudocercospora fuligena]|uniref:Soluble epoxide hydrolase n=1 Tax=Pseudocercospora fuligena TaxID=685502 RepID=A0A8H6RLJ4_9PEZI|nr:Soluble epoxide hydrolase [Pseudocercospora fuligena]